MQNEIPNELTFMTNYLKHELHQITEMQSPIPTDTTDPHYHRKLADWVEDNSRNIYRAERLNYWLMKISEYHPTENFGHPVNKNKSLQDWVFASLLKMMTYYGTPKIERRIEHFGVDKMLFCLMVQQKEDNSDDEEEFGL